LVPRYANDVARQDALYSEAERRAPSYMRGISRWAVWPEKEVVRAIKAAARGMVQVNALDNFYLVCQVEPICPPYRVIVGTWSPDRHAARERSRRRKTALAMRRMR
jgi:hypothetical protein